MVPAQVAHPARLGVQSTCTTCTRLGSRVWGHFRFRLCVLSALMRLCLTLDTFWRRSHNQLDSECISEKLSGKAGRHLTALILESNQIGKIASTIDVFRRLKSFPTLGCVESGLQGEGLRVYGVGCRV